MSLRERHDATRRLIALRVAQPGHPMRATVTVVIHGRTSLGRSAPRTITWAVDLLFGQQSEAHLLRQVQDAIESTYYSDIHVSQRDARTASFQAREVARHAEHEAFMADARQRTQRATKRLRVGK